MSLFDGFPKCSIAGTQEQSSHRATILNNCSGYPTSTKPRLRRLAELSNLNETKIPAAPKWRRSYTTGTQNHRAQAPNERQLPHAQLLLGAERAATANIMRFYTPLRAKCSACPACSTEAYQARTPPCAARPHAPSHTRPER